MAPGYKWSINRYRFRATTASTGPSRQLVYARGTSLRSIFSLSPTRIRLDTAGSDDPKTISGNSGMASRRSKRERYRGTGPYSVKFFRLASRPYFGLGPRSRLTGRVFRIPTPPRR